jgi:hypothetical protein
VAEETGSRTKITASPRGSHANHVGSLVFS